MKKYIQHLQSASTVKFIVTLAVIAFLSKIPTGIIGTMLVDLFDVTNPIYSSALQEPTFSPEDMFLAIVLAPILETLLAQMLPILIISFFTQSKNILILGSSTIFMLFHYPAIEFFPSAFVVGIVFAWAWVVKQNLGILKTFVIVTLIHSLHNAMVAAFAAILL